MSTTIDVNVLVYASNQADPAHDAARDLLGRLAAGPDIVYVFWPVAIGYLRIVTHAAILPRPLGAVQAMGNVAGLLARPHVHAAGEEPGFWDVYRDTAGEQARGNEVPDAHLVALMRQHGVRVLYTRDRSFRRFDGVEVRDPMQAR
ncbi:MAG: TA system VapC family ribonuclease toxin [Solirubrobacterales bacterium]